MNKRKNSKENCYERSFLSRLQRETYRCRPISSCSEHIRYACKNGHSWFELWKELYE